jgi:hypothetical protein
MNTEKLINSITDSILLNLNDNYIIIDKNNIIKFQNAVDSLESMIESSERYYLKATEELNIKQQNSLQMQHGIIIDNGWIEALKEDIEIAKISLFDLKQLIKNYNE